MALAADINEYVVVVLPLSSLLREMFLLDTLGCIDERNIVCVSGCSTCRPQNLSKLPDLELPGHRHGGEECHRMCDTLEGSNGDSKFEDLLHHHP